MPNQPRVLLDPDVKEQTGGASTPDTQAQGSAVKEPSLGDIVAQAATASAAAGPDGLQGGGTDPENKPGGVPEKDTTSEEELPEGDEEKAPDDSKEDAVDDEGEESGEEDKDGEAEDEEDKTEDKAKPEDAKDPDKNEKHPRIRELVTERNTIKAEYEAAKPYIDAQKQTVEFCQRFGITAEDYNDTLNTLALLKTDPAKAAERLKPLFETLRPYLGGDEVMDKDLSEDVEKSFMTVERAKELQRARNQLKAGEARQKLGTAQSEQQFYRDRVTSLNSWDMAQRTKDPSFKPKAKPDAVDGKYEYVSAKFQMYMAQNPQANAAQAVALAEKAYTEGQAFFKAHTTPKPLTRKLPRTNGSSGNMAAEPKTLHELVVGVANGTIKVPR